MAKEALITNISRYLSTEEQKQFFIDLLKSVKKAKIENDFSIIDACIEDWEDIAELNSLPNFKENVWKRFNRLKEAGLVR